jgi:uncharacterized protein YjiS (DUF1127 family)
MIRSFYQSLNRRFDAHRRYRRAIAEIAALTQDDLIDIGAFQIDLYRAARKEIFG